MIKDLKYYMLLDYDIVVRDLTDKEGGGVLAYYIDLPFIMGDGDTKSEARNAQKSKRINITLPNDLLNKIDMSLLKIIIFQEVHFYNKLVGKS